MDVAVAVSGYVSKIVALGDGAAGSSAKMKILLLDSETVGFVTKLHRALHTDTITGFDSVDCNHPIRPPQA
jgi:hypothetical protein